MDFLTNEVNLDVPKIHIFFCMKLLKKMLILNLTFSALMGI